MNGVLCNSNIRLVCDYRQGRVSAQRPVTMAVGEMVVVGEGEVTDPELRSS